MIQYTHTIKICIYDIASHLRRIKVEPKEAITAITEHFENRVNDFLLSCQVFLELLKIGCAQYRECNAPDGYRVLYSIGEDGITAYAILSHRQDI